MLVLATLVVLAWTAAVGPSWARGGPAAGRHVHSARTLMTMPGRVIVKFHAGSTAASRRAVAADAGARVLHAVPARWLTGGASLAVVTSASESTGALMKRLLRDPAVAYVEPDAVVQLAVIPDDPLWDDLWGMQAISAPRAWDSGVGSPDVVVADLATGVD